MSSNAPYKQDKDKRLDRHSASGRDGTVKKRGHARKSGWGRPGDEVNTTADDGVLDTADPNYDSEGDDVPDKVVVEKRTGEDTRLVWYKQKVNDVFSEFFVSHDLDEALHELHELRCYEWLGDAVKKLVSMSCDRKGAERELASEFLAQLCIEGGERASDAVADGLAKLLESIDDLALDLPDVVEVLAIFIARAVVDECVAPAFIRVQQQRVRPAVGDEPEPRAIACTRKAEAMLKGKHVAVRLAHGWGAGDHQSVDRLKEQCVLLLEEYLDAGDQAEAERRVRELASRFIHFYVVKKAFALAIEKADKDKGRLLKLVAAFEASGLFSEQHVQAGMRECFASLDDLRLDTPNAVATWTQLCADAVALELVDQKFVDALNAKSTDDATKTAAAAPADNAEKK